MGYRIKEHKDHKPHRTMQDTATPSGLYVQNGTMARLAIPCWYYVVDPPVRMHHHDRMHHDHIGWPSPNHPDHICQDWDFVHSCCSHNIHKHVCDHCHMFIDMNKFFPIHLEEEGYTSVDVAFVNPPVGLKASGVIDDYMVRLYIEPMCSDAVEKNIDVPYTVFVNGTMNKRKVRDVVAKGILHILSGATG